MRGEDKRGEERRGEDKRGEDKRGEERTGKGRGGERMRERRQVVSRAEKREREMQVDGN